MLLVIIESPFQDRMSNLAYARRCIADSLARGEAPFASHVLYPGVLDDTVKEQRALGMQAGHAWRAAAQLCAVYRDKGITPGMEDGINASFSLGQKVEYRWLDKKGTEE